jgi:hypothetical protein
MTVLPLGVGSSGLSNIRVGSNFKLGFKYSGWGCSRACGGVSLEPGGTVSSLEADERWQVQLVLQEELWQTFKTTKHLLPSPLHNY